MEIFKKQWNGVVRSSAGYSIKLSRPATIKYSDKTNKLIRIDCEFFGTGDPDVAVYGFPHNTLTENRIIEVLANVQKLFDYAGWHLKYELTDYSKVDVYFRDIGMIGDDESVTENLKEGEG